MGPIDYRQATADNLRLVESFHFTPEVETLRRGKSGSVGADIAYTLDVFPNHPRALRSLIALVEREKRERPSDTRYPITCYFARAIDYVPTDGTVRLLNGIFLLKQRRTGEATKELEAAEELAAEDPNVHYNLGLAYFDLKDYSRAMTHARKAYDAGFPFPGLRQKLTSVGAWRE